ncbi:MAG: DUF4231 domain-containing protein [Aggregatilineales bacterium]
MADAPETSKAWPIARFAQPVTQAARGGWRSFMPAFIQEMPYLRFPNAPNPQFRLIEQKHIDAIKELYPEATERIEADIAFMDYELLRLFVERDYEAKSNQNRYRVYQLLFLALATVATLIGSFQALALNSSPEWLPIWAFLETVVALLATFLATVSGREPPLPRWLDNRRRAEQLRREYFRFLMNLPPYNSLTGYKRQVELSRRAADINRGMFPDEPTVLSIEGGKS